MAERVSAAEGLANLIQRSDTKGTGQIATSFLKPIIKQMVVEGEQVDELVRAATDARDALHPRDGSMPELDATSAALMAERLYNAAKPFPDPEPEGEADAQDDDH